MEIMMAREWGLEGIFSTEAFFSAYMGNHC